jgi:hypothetical protein
MVELFWRSLVGLLVGAVCGGLSLGIVLGISSYADTSSYFLMGSGRDWTAVAIFNGLTFGASTGGILGFLVGALRTDERSSLILGGLIGLVFAGYWFAMASSKSIPSSAGLVIMSSIIFGAVVCFVVASALRKIYS